ncbi:hypothetical protein TL16_g12163 [Triparma laevis f. inornata]|uniref:Uncharacterized protein n=1 Tax=Triparma laevis f. inornata TaxID=1714386 RepID=A0A9W7BPR1_9STRA|nr:hypothetical protein TL16_g12163 [Triparma laevis f. inornata]
MANEDPNDDSSNEDASDACHQSFGEFACLNLGGLPLILCSILLGLVVLILLLEQGIHHMKHAAQNSRFWKKFWEALEGEMIMLGILSFTLFLLTQGLTGSQDESLEHFITLIEFVHIILFITMITYICIIARSGQIAQRWIARMRKQQANFQRLQKVVEEAESESFWEKFKSCCAKTDNENNADSDSSSQTDSLSMSESESYSKFAAKIFHFALESEHRAYKVCCRSPIAATLKLISWLMCCCAGQPLRRGKVWFSRTRLSFGREKDKKIDVYMVATQYLLCDAFLRSQNLPVDLPFDFVEYTSKCTTHMFVKMVKLGWRLWTIFLTFISFIATFSGFYHKINGNVVENTDNIFTNNPDDNLVFYNTFFAVGWILLFYNFRSISTTDTTFEKLIKLEMKRIRARERLAAERETNSGTETNSGAESVTNNQQPLSPAIAMNDSAVSSLALPLLSPQRDPNATVSTATTMDVSLGIKPEAKWLCVRLNGKSGRETFCPCTVTDMSPYKKLFFMNAPDWKFSTLLLKKRG